MTDDFYRIRRLPPYVFAEVNAMKAAARARGEDIVDLGMGNPDGAPPRHVIEKLAEVAAKPTAHRYSASKGLPGLRKAQAAYYQRRFGVELDPDSEVIVTLGSKEGLANLAQAITAPGDVVLTPNPSYPIHHFGFIIAGASIRSIPAVPGPDFFERLERAMRYTVPRPKVLAIGYPSNPTAQVVDLDFYRQLVEFARAEGLWVISDLAYAEIYFGDTPTPSILQVPGAREVAVEFTSMSKTYSMAGWRIGFAVGNERLISALTRVKSYLDYGAFTPIQAAAVAALNGPQDCVDANRQLYKGRRDVLVECFGRAGWASRCRWPACSPGRPYPSRSGSLEAWNLPKSCWPRPMSRSHRASGLARRAKVSSESRWSRMSSACARPRAGSGLCFQSDPMPDSSANQYVAIKIPASPLPPPGFPGPSHHIVDSTMAPSPIEKLTERQCQCLRLYFDRYLAKEIAHELGISKHAVNEDLRDAREILGVGSSGEAARLLNSYEQDNSIVPKPIVLDQTATNDNPGFATEPEIPAKVARNHFGPGIFQKLGLVILAAFMGVSLVGALIAMGEKITRAFWEHRIDISDPPYRN